MDHAKDFGQGSHSDLDALVVFGCGVAEGELLGEEDVHGFGQEAGAGEVADVVRPLFGAVAGFFDEFAFGGGNEFFSGLDAAGGELEEELAGGVTVLTDEQDVGVGGAAGVVDGEDDD